MNAAVFRNKISKYTSELQKVAIASSISAGIAVSNYPTIPTHDGRRGFFITYRKVFPTVPALRQLGYEVVVCPRTGRHIVMPMTSEERRLCEKDETVDARNIPTLRAILDNKQEIMDAMAVMNLSGPAFESIYKLGVLTNAEELLVFLSGAYPSHIPIELVEAAQTYVAKMGMLRGNGSIAEFREIFYLLVKNSMFDLKDDNIFVVLHRVSVPVVATAEFAIEEVADDSAFIRVMLK